MHQITKVKDLIEALSQCDPNGTVKLSLDAALFYDNEEPGTVEYGFAPLIDLLYSRQAAERCDRVYFRLSEDDISRIASVRREEKEADSIPSTAPWLVTAAPVAIAIALNWETYLNLLAVVNNCNRIESNNAGATSHGKLDIPRLISMLAEDTAMTHSRPGSWEGAGIRQLLASHGY